MTKAHGRTTAVVLTPQGRGAVSVIRVQGPDAVGIADAAFRPARGRPLACTASGQIRLGRVGAGAGDEVVAVVLNTAPAAVEIHAHGGPAAVALVLDALAALGACVPPVGEWGQSTGLAGLAAEAEADLARVTTLRVAEILLDQLDGALGRELERLLELIDTAPTEAAIVIDTLLARAAAGARLVPGWRVALAGRPNVGKSRLLNALAGYERAIVDATPGTTRDAVVLRTAFDGWPVELVDTAGLRATHEDLEAAGIARARALHAEADLVLLVLDLSRPLSPADRELLGSHPAALRVANKADLPAAWDPADLGCAVVSAQEGTGVDGLAAAAARRLVPDAPPPGAGVPFRHRHARHLVKARIALRAGSAAAARSCVSSLRSEA